MRVIALLFFCLFVNAAFAQNLVQTAQEKMKVLDALIVNAEKAGIDAQKEKMTLRTAEIFLEFADWDAQNPEENETYFKKVKTYRDSAAILAQQLPIIERKGVVRILDEAISELHLLIAGAMEREPSQSIDWSSIKHKDDRLLNGDRPIFLADYTWQPRIPKLSEYHGDLDLLFASVGQLELRDGNIQLNPRVKNKLIERPNKSVGFIFLNHKQAPKWATKRYGEGFSMREDTYTGYDIDHPGAREMTGALLDEITALARDKKVGELGYMLCNEPHFFTRKKAWASGPVSDYTVEKFKVWLKEKHGSIEDLNAVWKTDFTDFNAVELEIPIPQNLRGTPEWYDWCFFNMHRVTEWYTWMRDRIKEIDPNAKVHLKIMPVLWAGNNQDHGIDLEALTEMSDIIGNDAAAPFTTLWGKAEHWEKEYAFDWTEIGAAHDFMKSVSPDKMMFNSENHFLSTVKSRGLYQDPAQVRAAFWLAHTTGLDANQIWYWARNADGSISKKASKGYAGSNNQQPRVVNEVHATIMDLNAHAEHIIAFQRQEKPLRVFYSKTSAINKATHFDDVFAAYENLSFAGVNLGFVTENILEKQNAADWEVVVVADTEFVTQAELTALQNYLNAGGTVVTDALSLQKNEYGDALPALKAAKGKLIKVNSPSEMKTTVFSILSEREKMPTLQVKENNPSGKEKCHRKQLETVGGAHLLSIINLGKEAAEIELSLPDESSIVCKDLLRGVYVPTKIVLQPKEMLFAEVKKSTAEKVRFKQSTANGFSVIFPVKQKKVSLQVFDAKGKETFSKKYKSVKEINEQLSETGTGEHIVVIKHDSTTQRFLLKQQ